MLTGMCIPFVTIGKKSSTVPRIFFSDMFDILIDNPSLMSTIHCEPADYTGAGTYTLDREATVEDICDFVVEYINSDVLVSYIQQLFVIQNAHTGRSS